MPNSIQKSVEPFLLPFDHPVRQHLDHICRNYAAYDIDSLTRSYSGQPGCSRLNEGGRNVTVLTHHQLSEHGLMIKAPLRITLLNRDRKHNHLLRRVQGHHFGNNYVKNLKHVKVTMSWLYPVPVDASFVEWFIDFIARPFRIALKCLGLKCPSWLKYADRVLSEKFIVVEELIDIKEFNIDQLNNLSREAVDECIEVNQKVGFGDAVETNFSLDNDNDQVTLFDLDQFSHKEAKRQENGKAGAVYMFRHAKAHSEYVWEKLRLSRKAGQP